MEAIGYHEERKHWGEFQMHVSENHAKRIVRKLARHFKLGNIHVRFYGRRDSGYASRFREVIKISHNATIGVICHEVNHFLCWKKFDERTRHGTKQWCRQLQRVINYCQKKNYWIEEQMKTFM